MFKYKCSKNGYCYYHYKEKLYNNQTVDMKFWDEDEMFFVELSMYSKRKHAWSDNKTHGKVGIKSLTMAKTIIKLFIDFLSELDKIKKHNKIVISWTDNRRQRVYHRGLKDMGFKYEYLTFDGNTVKYLTKDLIKK